MPPKRQHPILPLKRENCPQRAALMLTLQSPVPLLHIWSSPKISLVKASTPNSLPMKVILQVGQKGPKSIFRAGLRSSIFSSTNPPEMGKTLRVNSLLPMSKSFELILSPLFYVVHYITEVRNLKLEFNLVEILLHRPTV